MGLLRVSEFAEKYGIVRNNVYTYEKRRKLIITDGWVDEDNPVNKLWIQTKTGEFQKVKKEIVKKVKEYETVIPKQTRGEVEISNEVTQKKIKSIVNYSDGSTGEILRTNQLKDELLELDIRMKRLKTEREEGKVVSVDLVKQSVSEIVMRFKTSFLQQVEQLTRDVLNEVQAGNETITSTCTRLIDISNEVSKRALKETDITMSNIVEEMNGK
jgi:DNA polymerase III delta prime subunit